MEVCGGRRRSGVGDHGVWQLQVEDEFANHGVGWDDSHHRAYYGDVDGQWDSVQAHVDRVVVHRRR